MTVKIVADSAGDIPAEIAKAFDITIVPLYVQFGSKTFRDGVDIVPEQFFRMLDHDSVIPTTSTAAPYDFAETYRRLHKDSDGIISIHISSKVSATYNAACRGRDMLEEGKDKVEVVDSKLATMGMGLLAIHAAKAAKEGQNLPSILEQIAGIIPTIKVFGLLDTLKYVARGGRLGKLGTLLGSVLPLKPLLTIKDGMVEPFGAVRTRTNGIERIFDLVKSCVNIKEVAISHSSSEDEVKSFVDRLKTIIPEIKPTIAKLGPALGVHGGPGTFLVAVQQNIESTSDIEGKHKKILSSLPSLQEIKENISQKIQRDSLRPFGYKFGPALS